MQIFTGHENNIVQPKPDKCFSSTSHFSLTVVEVSFCSFIKETNPKIHVVVCPNK